MTKKRKQCSPPEERSEKSDTYTELKEFIVCELAKSVRDFKEANERRLTATDESLNFTHEAVVAVSKRQNSADADIFQLRKEMAEVRQRLREMELSEDRRLQQTRLTCLLFAGRELQRQNSREDAMRLIQSLVQRHLHHSMDHTQISTVARLKSGRVLVEFTSAAPGSDRDILFRTKTRLRGSGLYISESLTPRRQEMFADLLALKRDGIIFQSSILFYC